MTIAKVIGFGWTTEYLFPNRIFFVPWRQDTGKWAPETSPMRSIPLSSRYIKILNSENDWESIKVLEKCPEEEEFKPFAAQALAEAGGGGGGGGGGGINIAELGEGAEEFFGDLREDSQEIVIASIFNKQGVLIALKDCFIVENYKELSSLDEFDFVGEEDVQIFKVIKISNETPLKIFVQVWNPTIKMFLGRFTFLPEDFSKMELINCPQERQVMRTLSL
jgi:hypothetical protein